MRKTKYNLVWDRILGLGVFPEDIVRSVVGGYFIQML